MPENKEAADSPAPTISLDKLGDVLKVLAEGTAQNPAFAAIGLILGLLVFLLLGLAGFAASADPSSPLASNLPGFLWGSFIVFALAVLSFILLFFKQVRENEVELEARQTKAQPDVVTIDVLTSLPHRARATIAEAIGAASNDVADKLGVRRDHVRANIFALDATSQRLGMVSEFTHNMPQGAERTIQLPVGYGSTGQCYAGAKINIATLEKDWGKDNIEEAELKKVDSDLRWIISIPVLAPGSTTQAIAVLNIDGKDPKTEQDLKSIAAQLTHWSQLLTVAATSN